MREIDGFAHRRRAGDDHQRSADDSRAASFIRSIRRIGTSPWCSRIVRCTHTWRCPTTSASRAESGQGGAPTPQTLLGRKRRGRRAPGRGGGLRPEDHGPAPCNTAPHPFITVEHRGSVNPLLAQQYGRFRGSCEGLSLMRDGKVWFITGASSGIGASLVKAALAAGNAVVATGRRVDAVAEVVGDSKEVLIARLDVTSTDDAAAAVMPRSNSSGGSMCWSTTRELVQGILRGDVTSTGRAAAGDEPAGPMNVTRAVLPVMRQQRSGHVISISSGAGLVAFEYSSVYAASKFGLEGWMGALEQEVAPFGIRTTIVNPGFFRTGLASPGSLIWPELSVADYAERSAAQREWWEAQDGRQSGDPDKLAQALLDDRGRGTAAATLHRWRGRDRVGRAQDRANFKSRSHPTGVVDVDDIHRMNGSGATVPHCVTRADL